MELNDAQNHRLTFSFACASDPHELHGILADLGELPSHGAVPKHPHEIVEMPFGSRSQVKPLQPLLHGEGLYLGNWIVAPPRFDLVVEVRLVRIDGRVPSKRQSIL